MKIGFVCNEYPPFPHGGIGTFTQIMARAFVQAGHSVRVVGAYPAQANVAEYEEDQGVQVWRFRLASSRLRWVYAHYRVYRRVAEWCRNGEVDLIDAPDWEGWIAGWPRLSVPVIIRLQGCVGYFAAEMGKPVDRLTYWLEKNALRRADFWASVSEYAQQKTELAYHVQPAWSRVLFNPVEIPAGRLPPAAARPNQRVVFAGTLTPKKGIISLIRAWPKIVASCPGAELHVYGKNGRTDDGRSMQDYLTQTLDPKLRDRVHFYGHVPQAKVLEAYETARVAVLPSYVETFGMVAAEAMIRGCPVVFGNRTSGPEVVEHQQSGLLVDPDQVDEIATATIRLLADDDLATRLGTVGQQRARDLFSVPALLEQTLSFYDECRRRFPTRQHRAAVSTQDRGQRAAEFAEPNDGVLPGVR